MTGVELLAGVAVVAGALLQSAVGFGFALVCAPLVFAASPSPEQAVGLLIILGLEVNLLTLAGERRRPAPLRREVAVLLAWSVPGSALGVLVLRAADATLLQIVVTVVVVGGLVAQRWAARVGGAVRPAPAWAAPAAGVSSGALSTSTGASGPPLVLYLIGRGVPPLRLRDTLTATFIGLSVTGWIALTLGGERSAVPDGTWLAALIPAVVVGHVAGRPVFERLARGRYEAVLTGVLLASAVAGLLVALV